MLGQCRKEASFQRRQKAKPNNFENHNKQAKKKAEKRKKNDGQHETLDGNQE